MKILLHTCCGPCFIYPLELLRNEGFEVEAYFYNPNIYPEEEYLRRKAAFLDFVWKERLKIHIPEYHSQDFSQAITDIERPGRCLDCWQLRLRKAAEFARANNIPAFTSALLASPYQDIEAIRKIGQALGQEYRVEFLDRDFRAGFRQAHNKARALGMYCQKYCGCGYSLQERSAALARKKQDPK